MPADLVIVEGLYEMAPLKRVACEGNNPGPLECCLEGGNRSKVLCPELALVEEALEVLLREEYQAGYPALAEVDGVCRVAADLVLLLSTP